MNTLISKTIWLMLGAVFIFNTPLYADVALKPDTFLQRVNHHIKAQLDQENALQSLVCQGELICGLKLMPIFYQERQYAPVWFDHNGLRPAAKTLIGVIQKADRDGLHPADYHISIINMLLADYDYWPLDSKDNHQAAIRADLDLLLTDAFLLLSTHLAGGRIDPETLHADWIVPDKAIDVMDVLHDVAANTDLGQIIDQLRPDHDGYVGLRQALRQMRQHQAQGGWPIIESGATIKPGAQDNRIPKLRRRLQISSDLEAVQSPEMADRYDDQLVKAIKHFQQRHGLKPDGVIGKQTLAAINIPVDQRVRQIELNLERWRWLPRDLSPRHILVNTANFSLQVMENQQTVLDMRVVVGRPARRTPIFSAPISYLVLNPYWTVPHKLAVEDILPKLAKGLDYLTQQGFQVFKGWGKNAQTIDPNTVNWKIYGNTYFPFRLRQDPGPRNALGRIKFMMPNKFSVYLHDTPQRSLFNVVQRDFSSGCIRVQDARALANYLLSNDPAWSPEAIDSNLSEGQRQVVRLSNPIPVHLLYMTAWLDDDGAMQFRNDIYDRDRDLNRALAQRQPAQLPPLSLSEISASAN